MHWLGGVCIVQVGDGKGLTRGGEQSRRERFQRKRF